VIVCHCHRVTDSAVGAAVDAGCSHLREVVRLTRAGTRCGGCVPQLRAVCERALAEAQAQDADRPVAV
jgi:bacterioferritin-associated ferredoxin